MLTAEGDLDQSTDYRVQRFLAHETTLLNARQFHEWLDLLTDDFVYRVLVPYTPENLLRDPWIDDAFLLDENRDSLRNLWGVRYSPEVIGYAWGENGQRVRRFVTGSYVTTGEGPGLYAVQSNVLLSFARQSDPVVFVPACRLDVVREENGELRLSRRLVHIDQTIVTTTHLRMVF